MMKTTIKVLVEGGKASAGPPLGPALGPLGVDITKIVEEINVRTKDFSGMCVPVKITIDEKKNFEIEVGTPPVSALIKKELDLEKLSARSDEKVGDLRIQQCIKIAKAKLPDLNTASLEAGVKQVIGSCLTCGITVEGLDPREAIRQIDAGKWRREISAGITELSEEDMQEIAKKKKELAAELERKKEEERKIAEKIVAELAGKDIQKIKTRLKEEGVSEEIIKEVLEKGEEKK
jgi:large subunit ribosomal protein L11